MHFVKNIRDKTILKNNKYIIHCKMTDAGIPVLYLKKRKKKKRK